MKPRKPKTSEPSLRDKLSAAFLEAFQSDFEANGVAAIEQLRNKSPDKYTEIAARLIAATEPQSQPTGFASCDSMEDSACGYLKALAPRAIPSRRLWFRLQSTQMMRSLNGSPRLHKMHK